jgi:uncharacterized membrane protein YeaQ/YmgE (transglycosylase-associated protein family)
VGIVSWLVFGLLAGAVARILTPGRHPRLGCIGTIAVGMVGALIGGLIGDVVLGDDNGRFEWSLGPFLLAVLGAVVLLVAIEAIARPRRRWW